MIQRIQSLYLFFVALLSIASNAFVVGVFSSEQQVIKMYYCHLSYAEAVSESISVTPIAITSVLIFILSIFIILRFKNRKAQLKLNSINILLNMIWVGFIAFYFFSIKTKYLVEGNLTFFAIIPVVNIILLILATRSIKKDEALIKSVDRIR